MWIECALNPLVGADQPIYLPLQSPQLSIIYILSSLQVYMAHIRPPAPLIRLHIIVYIYIYIYVTARFTTTDQVQSRSNKSVFRIRELSFPPKLKRIFS